MNQALLEIGLVVLIPVALLAIFVLYAFWLRWFFGMIGFLLWSAFNVVVFGPWFLLVALVKPNSARDMWDEWLEGFEEPLALIGIEPTPPLHERHARARAEREGVKAAVDEPAPKPSANAPARRIEAAKTAPEDRDDKADEPDDPTRCRAATTAGRRCRNRARDDSMMCGLHSGMEDDAMQLVDGATAARQPLRCMALTAKGGRCSGRAQEGSRVCGVHADLGPVAARIFIP